MARGTSNTSDTTDITLSAENAINDNCARCQIIISSSNMHQYKLEKGSKKYCCPQCTKNTFVPYVDILSGEKLPMNYGRCDRESKCAYHLNPYVDSYAKNQSEQYTSPGFSTGFQPHRKQPIKPLIYFDFDTFKKTLDGSRYAQNTFIQNLLTNVPFPFEIDEVTKVVELYRLGTIANGFRAGANTFPFIDVNNNVRAIQVKQFNARNETISTDFLHSIIDRHLTKNKKPLPKWLIEYNQNERKVSCLFGEHLLRKYPSNPIALVEAPKTAIYGTLYFGLPNSKTDLIWLAVYNKSSFTFDKLKALAGRLVYVFPDLSKNRITFNEWEKKAKVCESGLNGTKFIFSDLLERLAPEHDKSEGKDIADYLIKLDWRKFRKPKTIEPIVRMNSETSEPIPDRKPPTEKPNNWDNEIAELENYFQTFELPNHPIQLNEATTIQNSYLFIESHLATIKKNNGNRTFKPYLERLQAFKNLTIPNK